MEARRPRAELVPNANNPRLLLRLVGLVASGVRRPALLAEVLEVELRTVHYYSQAAQWLGLLEADGELRLSPRGLALAYAEPAEQARQYAEAAWANPLAARLLGAGEDLPPVEAIAEIIREVEPGLADATARRRASSLRSLLSPAAGRRPAPAVPRAQQLGLPFPAPSTPPPPTPVDLRAGVDESFDVYRRLLLALLDHGELSSSQVRAVLDAMGARDAALGAYVEVAARRGDAVRMDDRLVATRGAAQRRDVAEDGVLVALTDPLYREYLAALEQAALPARRGPQAMAEAQRLRARLGPLASRFAPWDLRIFGQRLQPGAVDLATSGLLVGRSLAATPVAAAPGAPLRATTGPFLDQVELEGVAVTFPRALLGLRGGVAVLNERLRVERAAPAGVRLPGPLDPRLRVHGGLLAPGEEPPRAIPDNFSLRLRAITHTPALSLLTALLLAGRRGPDRPVVRAPSPPDTPTLDLPGGERAPLLRALERFCAACDMVALRPASGGLADADLVQLAVDLGLAVRARERLLLEEALFVRLQEDPECRLVYEALLPWEDRLMAWFEALEGRGSGRRGAG